MADLLADIRSALLGMNSVTALVGTGAAAKIRPDHFDQADAPPAILMELDSEDRESDLDGLGGLIIGQVVITCRGRTRTESRQLAEAVRTNNATPGTGLAGYAGAFDLVLDSSACAETPKGDGSQGVWFDVVQDYTVIRTETV